jgi:hypothetical protein
MISAKTYAFQNGISVETARSRLKHMVKTGRARMIKKGHHAHYCLHEVDIAAHDPFRIAARKMRLL